MVRVIPVHSFLEQKVARIEEPSASCTAGDFLLLALPSHCVEVWDLTTPDLGSVTNFPTVDLVVQMIHCDRGNYVATLETRVKKNMNCVRVYVNWSTKEQQPMRARIAGRVTSSLNGPQSLEMIELPLNIRPTAIACCQSTGNLLVAAGDNLILHEFKLETHSQSKLKFIDFEARPWGVGLHFFPTHLQIVEDFVSIMDSSRCVVFRLTNPIYEDIDQFSSLTSVTSSLNDKTISTDISSMKSLDNSHSLSSGNLKMIKWKKNTSTSKKNETDENSNPFLNLAINKSKNSKCIDWNNLVNNEKRELNFLIDKGTVDHDCHSFSMNLPSISSEKIGPIASPDLFITDSADTEVFIKTIPDNGWSENYEIKNVLQLKIVKEGDDSTEMFTNLILKPLYLKTQKNCGIKKSIFRSEKYKHLNGVTCLISTTQEGFIYHFDVQHDHLNISCLTNYQFTAALTYVSLENSILHAMTDAGLESYTLRLCHHIAKAATQFNNLEIACPDSSEPISLIGLRSFVEVQDLLNTNKFILILTKAENSWTLYSLSLPVPEKVYSDIIKSAENHR